MTPEAGINSAWFPPGANTPEFPHPVRTVGYGLLVHIDAQSRRPAHPTVVSHVVDTRGWGLYSRSKELRGGGRTFTTKDTKRHKGHEEVGTGY